jgi:glycosyltransferase involved in cell wall biosynthesis
MTVTHTGAAAPELTPLAALAAEAVTCQRCRLRAGCRAVVFGEGDPHARLMFVGDTHRGQEEFAESLKARAAQPPLAGRVMFFPFTEQILPYYEATDINLLVSRDEGFGRTVIEAGAVGISSVGARVGGIAEIIVDGVSGRLVPPDDPAALAEALESMITNEALRREMGEGAFRRSAQEFSIGAHTRQVMDLFDEVLETKAASL